MKVASANKLLVVPVLVCRLAPTIVADAATLSVKVLLTVHAPDDPPVEVYAPCAGFNAPAELVKSMADPPQHPVSVAAAVNVAFASPM